MSPKDERFEMRLNRSLLDRVDSWRSKQNDLPSRAESIRRLTEVGLAHTSDAPMAMSPSEKLIVTLLCELHRGSKIKGELDPNFIETAICGGHHWGLKWKYEGILHNYNDDPKILEEVLDILDMWSFIESATKKLSPKNKDYIKTNTKYAEDTIKFRGFDGNNECEHLGIALFLINEMNRFTEFKDRGGYKGDLNSHCPSIDVYRRMLEVFLPIRKNLVGRDLNVKEIVEILKARVHPSMRGK